MIKEKDKRDVKEYAPFMPTPHSAIARFRGHSPLRASPSLWRVVAILAIGWASIFPVMAQQPGDFAAGVYAYQQKDYLKAYQLLEPLAKRAHGAAQYNLGRMYARGEGVPQNYTEAYKWFFLAGKNGRKEGEQAMRTIAKRLTGKQIETAIQRASEESGALKR